MSVAPYEVRYLALPVEARAGGVRQCTQKAWVYPDGLVYWELRRIIRACRPDQKTAYETCREVSNNRTHWAAEFIAMGLDVSETLKASANSVKCTGEDDELLDPYVREEYSISTGGFFGLLQLWSQKRHSLAERQHAKDVLAALLKVTCYPPLGVWMRLRANIADSQHLCVPEPAADGTPRTCEHTVEVDAAIASSDTNQWPIIVEILGLARGKVPVCQRMRVALEMFWQYLVAKCNGAIHRDEHLCGMSSDPLVQDRFANGPKRQRVDEDYKRTVVVNAVSAGRAKCASQLIRAHGPGVDTTCGARWEEDDCLKLMAAAMLDFKTITHLHVCEDGSRIGKPAQETIVYLAWSAFSQKATYPPPQVVLSF